MRVLYNKWALNVKLKQNVVGISFKSLKKRHSLDQEEDYFVSLSLMSRPKQEENLYSFFGLI